MKSRRIVLALSLLAVTSDGLAQNADWQVVKGLQFGARISVKAARHSLHDPCIFQQASDEGLTCLYVTHSRWVPPSTITFPKAVVREVRLERSDAANIAVGTGIGAGVGAAIGGAVAPSGRKVGAAAGVGLIGSLVGGWFGLEFPILHGPVIYRARSESQKSPAKRQPSTRASVESRSELTTLPDAH